MVVDKLARGLHRDITGQARCSLLLETLHSEMHLLLFTVGQRSAASTRTLEPPHSSYSTFALLDNSVVALAGRGLLDTPSTKSFWPG